MCLTTKKKNKKRDEIRARTGNMSLMQRLTFALTAIKQPWGEALGSGPRQQRKIQQSRVSIKSSLLDKGLLKP